MLSAAPYREKALGNTLDAFLLTPVQRVPRYLMLLQQLLKQVWMKHLVLIYGKGLQLIKIIMLYL